MEVKKFDVIFSYWIFTWFILYYLNIVKYNPLFFLILALFSNLFIIIHFLYHKNYHKGLLFILVIFFIKILPIFLIRKHKITKEDIYFSIILFELYLVYIHCIYDYNFYNLYNEYSKLRTKELNTPLADYLKKIIK